MTELVDNSSKGNLGAKKDGVPEWATECLRSFIDDHDRLHKLLHLSMRGISVLRAMPKAFDALSTIEPEEYTSDDAKQRRQQIQEESELAQSEVDTGFELIHAQAVISLWSSLESAH